MPPHREARTPAPGPGSLTWRYFAQWPLGALLALWAGSMQNMHPGLGAGVEQHSDFFNERWQRLFRSLYPIYGVVYDGDRSAATAREVRDYHAGIKGVDARGRPYHALDPDTYFWAHATFFEGMIVAQDLFGDRLTDAEKEQLYRESTGWYALYRVGMRPVPPDYAAFRAYWDRMCTEVLEDTPAARQVLDVEGLAKPPVAGLPDAVWRVVRRPIGRANVWLTVGMYHPAVRERLGYRWTARDERRFRRVCAAVRRVWALVPESRRYHPRARAALSGRPPVPAPARFAKRRR
ncbi:oxygenase MpaB family protein [Streptodolium elevatio]